MQSPGRSAPAHRGAGFPQPEPVPQALRVRPRAHLFWETCPQLLLSFFRSELHSSWTPHCGLARHSHPGFVQYRD